MTIDDTRLKYSSRLTTCLVPAYLSGALQRQAEEILSNAIDTAYEDGLAGIDDGAKGEYETQMRTLLNRADVGLALHGEVIHVLHEAMDAAYDDGDQEDDG